MFHEFLLYRLDASALISFKWAFFASLLIECFWFLFSPKDLKSGFNCGEVNVTAASTRAKELVEVIYKTNSKYSDQVQGAICPKVTSALSQ